MIYEKRKWEEFVMSLYEIDLVEAAIPLLQNYKYYNKSQ